MFLRSLAEQPKASGDWSKVRFQKSQIPARRGLDRRPVPRHRGGNLRDIANTSSQLSRSAEASQIYKFGVRRAPIELCVLTKASGVLNTDLALRLYSYNDPACFGLFLRSQALALAPTS